jgi:hypothetical protein
MIVSAAQFWLLMCNAGFIRLSRLSGVMAGLIYVTLEAPEDQPGWLERVQQGIRDVSA